MNEWFGDVWRSPFPTICIPTNMMVKRSGEAVMGAGLALEANIASDYKAAKILGRYLSEGDGDGVFVLGSFTTVGGEKTLVSFPTKNDWRHKSCTKLIRRSAQTLATLIRCKAIPTPVALPRPGCGLGGLTWDDEMRRLLKESLGLAALEKVFIVAKA